MTIRPENLALLYAYNDWANRQILDQAAHLTPAQLDAPIEGGFGTVRETLVHAMEAEWAWLDDIWRGEAARRGSYVEFDPADFLDVTSIHERWNEVAADLQRFIAGLSAEGDDSPGQIIAYEGDAGEIRRRPLWLLMLHVVNHSTQHRAELAETLTKAGYSPGELDLTLFYTLRERGQTT